MSLKRNINIFIHCLMIKRTKIYFISYSTYKVTTFILLLTLSINYFSISDPNFRLQK